MIRPEYFGNEGGERRISRVGIEKFGNGPNRVRVVLVVVVHVAVVAVEDERVVTVILASFPSRLNERGRTFSQISIHCGFAPGGVLFPVGTPTLFLTLFRFFQKVGPPMFRVAPYVVQIHV